jgi:adenosylcobinamide-GDP ribazoletransferase
MPVLPPRWDDAARWWDEFRFAAGFLTRLPLGPRPSPDEMSLAQTSWSFPLVGIVVGLLGGFGYALAAWLAIPPAPAALIAVGVTILVTGGLHEDGLADSADGFGGGGDRDETLAIMRDSRLGTYGVLALIFSVALRAASLAAIGQGGRVAAALIAAHAVGRGFLPLVLRGLDPARAEGLGAGAGKPEAAIAWSAAGLAALVALVALDFLPGLVALAAAGLLMALRAGVARREIGGYTGDVLGALEQGGEIVVMLVAAAAWAM